MCVIATQSIERMRARDVSEVFMEMLVRQPPVNKRAPITLSCRVISFLPLVVHRFPGVHRFPDDDDDKTVVRS